MEVIVPPLVYCINFTTTSFQIKNRQCSILIGYFFILRQETNDEDGLQFCNADENSGQS